MAVSTSQSYYILVHIDILSTIPLFTLALPLSIYLILAHQQHRNYKE